MEEFGCRQNERDERRHAEGNKAQAVEFVSRYYSDIGLISLCAVVAMHNDLFLLFMRDVPELLLSRAGGSKSDS